MAGRIDKSDEWMKMYPWAKTHTKFDDLAYCKLCKRSFSFHLNGEEKCLKEHAESNIHKKNTKFVIRNFYWLTEELASRTFYKCNFSLFWHQISRILISKFHFIFSAQKEPETKTQGATSATTSKDFEQPLEGLNNR